MSYIRYGSKYLYVEGESDNYIYPSTDTKGKIYIEDYNSISDNTLVELIIQYLDCDYREFKEYLAKKLADKLSVKLREQVFKVEE